MQTKRLCCVGLMALCASGVLPLQACAPLAELENAVRVVDESVVIVWNSKTQEQHFIRQASFDSKARDIGFLVPSPSIPKLAEAKEYVFEDFGKKMTPEVKYVEKRKWYDWKFTSLMFARVRNTFNAAGTSMTTGNDGVEILQFQKVVGYDATTLRARDVKSLNRWLQKHGYVSSPSFADWLRPYIQKRWVVTAFKIRKKNKSEEKFSSSLVRMSFKTPRPFFPYSEPQNNRQKNSKAPRSLRIFFLSDARYKATPQSFGKHAAWPGSVVWSDNVNQKNQQWDASWIAESLALSTPFITNQKWLTVFEDNSSPRPGTSDVYFERDKNEIKHLPPIIVVRWRPRSLYIEPLIFLLSAALVFGCSWIANRIGRRLK